MAGPDVVVEQLVRQLNQGNLAACLAVFADDILIVDDIPPFRWTGHREAETWLSRVIGAGQSMKRSLDLDLPARCEIARNRAFLVVPGRLSISSPIWDGKVDGLLTFTLRCVGGSWLIDTAVWSGPSGSLSRHAPDD